jgi:membrane associated rhomboid family serine protease
MRTDLYQRFLERNVVEKLIILNILVFIVTYLLNTLSFLFDSDSNFIIDWFSLQPGFGELLFRPWTLITYGFLHVGFFHILFNLLILYYFGNLFLDFFDSGQFMTYFLLGVVSGGLIYMLSYNYLPALKTQQTILVGASAGVTAIVIGIASHIPHYSLHFRFIGSIKLMYIAIVMVVLDLVQIPTGNAGGHLAHLGGALMGYMLTRYMNQGRGVSNWWSSQWTPRKKSPLKTVYKNEASETASSAHEYDQKKIDGILDKISRSGYETLTKEEKDYLFKAGKN